MNLSELGIQAAKIRQFTQKGIMTAEDLVRYLPRKYMDFTRVTGIRPETETSCVLLKVQAVQAYDRTTPVLQASCKILPNGEPIKVTWFHQNYLYHKIYNLIDHEVFAAGKIKWNDNFKNYEMASPEVFEPDNPGCRRIKPIYTKIKGMSEDYLTTYIAAALRIDAAMGDVYPREIVSKYSALSTAEALRMLHNPASMDEISAAQDRLIGDDLLYFAACNEWSHRNSAIGSPFPIKTLKLYNDILRDLPYELTEDQAKAVEGMSALVRDGKRINALVQGDVGCGKTIVAMLMMSMFTGSGYQAVLMAPTQVLARQHYEDAVKLFGKHGVVVEYLGTDLKAKEKKAALQRIETGQAQIIIGTHSVLGSAVKYSALALTIADEEHRFGVTQREALVEKAAAGVHSITMSATPIPRSLAQVIYGNAVELFSIVTMPNGRKPVITGFAGTREKLFSYIEKQAEKGLQTYVVCPMIDRNEDMTGVKSVDEISEEFTRALSGRGVRIDTLTGKDKKERTEEVLGKFRAGEIDVLISTSVIEVGVNVPTATTMVIINAERFGLASLHQLRGRVGRGDYQSCCVLDAANANEAGKRRLTALVNSASGFDIAKEDLRLRGAGDFIGTRQSGENKMLALMLAYPERYALAQELAVTLIDQYGWTPHREEGQE